MKRMFEYKNKKKINKNNKKMKQIIMRVNLNANERNLFETYDEQFAVK